MVSWRRISVGQEVTGRRASVGGVQIAAATASTAFTAA